MNLLRAAMHPVSFCTSLIVAGAPHISDGCDLFWVGLDAPVTHDEPEQFTRRNAENALGQIELPSVFL
jgi:hypothetical protein